MRVLVIAALFIMFAFNPVLSETIKVLIIDEGFKSVPKKSEKLAMLDRVRGKLIVGYTNYMGDIEVWKGKDGLYLINELPLANYVEGVVEAETGRDWEMEALKAQAVIVRTYVLNRKIRTNDRKFHVTSSVLHQVYKGHTTDTKISAAVKATEGKILTYDGTPIAAFYHSTCGGKTEEPSEVFGKSYPYLKSVGTNCRLSPYSMWVRRIPVDEIERATGVSNIKDMKIKSRTSTGRVKELVILSGGRAPFSSEPETASRTENKKVPVTSRTLKAAELRKMLGWKRLPSTNFSIRLKGDTAVFEGKGYGHGVGLCQWCALEMAKEGKTYREILSHFYPGAKLKRYEGKGL